MQLLDADTLTYLHGSIPGWSSDSASATTRRSG